MFYFFSQYFPIFLFLLCLARIFSFSHSLTAHFHSSSNFFYCFLFVLPSPSPSLSFFFLHTHFICQSPCLSLLSLFDHRPVLTDVWWNNIHCCTLSALILAQTSHKISLPVCHAWRLTLKKKFYGLEIIPDMSQASLLLVHQYSIINILHSTLIMRAMLGLYLTQVFCMPLLFTSISWKVFPFSTTKEMSRIHLVSCSSN